MNLRLTQEDGAPATGMNQRQPILRVCAGGARPRGKLRARMEQRRKEVVTFSWPTVAMGSGAGRTGSEEMMENSPTPVLSSFVCIGSQLDIESCLDSFLSDMVPHQPNSINRVVTNSYRNYDKIYIRSVLTEPKPQITGAPPSSFFSLKAYALTPSTTEFALKNVQTHISM
jgi:hypothetical protein